MGITSLENIKKIRSDFTCENTLKTKYTGRRSVSTIMRGMYISMFSSCNLRKLLRYKVHEWLHMHLVGEKAFSRSQILIFIGEFL